MVKTHKVRIRNNGILYYLIVFSALNDRLRIATPSLLLVTRILPETTYPTAKTTILFPCPQEMTFNEAKTKILSALTQFPNETDVPSVSSTDDFEVCVGRKTKKVRVMSSIGPSYLVY